MEVQLIMTTKCFAQSNFRQSTKHGREIWDIQENTSEFYKGSSTVLVLISKVSYAYKVPKGRSYSNYNDICFPRGLHHVHFLQLQLTWVLLTIVWSSIRRDWKLLLCNLFLKGKNAPVELYDGGEWCWLCDKSLLYYNSLFLFSDYSACNFPVDEVNLKTNNSVPTLTLFTSLYIPGRAEIRDDIHSDAKELVIFSDVEASNEAKLASLNQPRMGYTSQRGLYIRVAKPIDKGHFNFVYGVFQETGLSVMCK